jgi:tetratricopeptide (TPR) repeat protein
MRSSIRLFYIVAIGLLVCAAVAAQAVTDARDPDSLYRQRANIARAREAAAIWDSRLQADPSNFDAAWKLARTMYWLGGHDVPSARRADLDKGVDAGRKAAMLEPRRPEGYFWMAADMGELAESFGLRQGLKYRGDIRQALETVLRLDPRYQDGSADRALGRWYFKVPGLFGGSRKKSEEHLRKSLTYAPGSIASHYFLAETLFELDRDAEARDELRKTIAAPIDPEWEPEDREFQQLAHQRLEKK